MVQNVKVIDVDKTFVPVDPKAFPENLEYTQGEDSPFKSSPIVAYEGYNFLPTPYGYKSYFGTNQVVGIDALTSKIDMVFIIQTDTYQNIAIALCDDGIWTKAADSSGAWTHAITLTIPALGSHRQWTKCVIGNTLYMYRAGEASYWEYVPNTVYGIPPIASPVVGLLATLLPYTGGPVAAGTYSYQIAIKNSAGVASLPSTAVSITLSAAAEVELSWTKYTPGADTYGYRIYRTSGTLVQYKDVIQYSPATQSSLDDNTGWTDITLPETIVLGILPITAVIPNFLNMAGQIGIFKAGGRLGFWDSANSTAWSNLDDFSDFTPSVTTLAGSSIFLEIKGRITLCLAHGDGFIIYSTKSIIYIRRSLDSTFQWDPLVVISDGGVDFPQEVTSAISNTIHFAYTTNGLYKIEKGIPEQIITEVTDYLKDTNDPIYLDMLEGRYLILGILDPLYINGLVQFTRGIADPITYVFPGGLDTGSLPPSIDLTGTDACYTLNEIFDGKTTQQQADAAAAATAQSAPPIKLGTFYQPVWTAYLSRAGAIDPDSIVFGPTPCATLDANGVELNFSPNTASSSGLLSNATNTTSGKTAISGTDAFIDGHWTMERFIAAQEAIWEIEESNREAYLNKILNKGSSTSKVLADQSTCTPSAAVYDYCALGRYIKGSGGRKFGYNGCSFWLSRYISQAVDINRVRVTQTVCNSNQQQFRYVWETTYPDYGTYTSLAEAAKGHDVILIATGPLTYTIVGLYNALRHKICADGSDLYDYGVCPAHFDSIYTVNAYNQGTDVDIAPVVDTGVCQITGWKYTGADGNTHTINSSACTMSDTNLTNDGNVPLAAGSTPPIDTQDGTVCSIPFEPVHLDGIGNPPLDWPTTTVTLPADSFLLQDGSIGPLYPTISGFLSYDLQLKKWGKAKLNYKVLLDYSPINTSAGETISSDTFGIHAGVVKVDGKLYLFDQYPLDSYIKYGKIGYYRKGFTAHEEAIAVFRTVSTGIMEVETSLEGSGIDPVCTVNIPFTDAINVNLPGKYSGKWHNISIRGNYDIQYMEFRGDITSRR